MNVIIVIENEDEKRMKKKVNEIKKNNIIKNN